MRLILIVSTISIIGNVVSHIIITLESIYINVHF